MTVQTTKTLTRIRPDELEWEMLGTHGLRRKVLGSYPDSGFITSLVDIPVGWHGGGIAHFHHAFEEVYMWAGSVTVGGTHYWHEGDYFYRPALVVHGHDERSEEGALAIIRSDGPLELLLVHEPTEPDEYPLEPVSDPRGHILGVTVRDLEWTTDPSLPEGWRIKPLSADSGAGARTFAVSVPAGWSRGDATLAGRDSQWEALVLSGSITGQGQVYERGDYTKGPAGLEAFDAAASDEGCEFLVWQLPQVAA